MKTIRHQSAAGHCRIKYIPDIEMPAVRNINISLVELEEILPLIDEDPINQPFGKTPKLVNPDMENMVPEIILQAIE